MDDAEFDGLFRAIKARYAELTSESRRASFLSHVRSLGTWESNSIDAYPTDAAAEFPDSIDIAFAVCHRDCGARELIVEGSTQECQRCGRLMFRTDVVTYRKT